MLLALLGRVLNWQRAPAEARAAYPGAIPRYLRRFLDDATTEVTGSYR